MLSCAVWAGNVEDFCLSPDGFDHSPGGEAREDHKRVNPSHGIDRPPLLTRTCEKTGLLGSVPQDRASESLCVRS